MATFINKALDLNKLFGDQAKGKLLKKNLTFPLYAPIKFDGNYVAVVVERGRPVFNTSGGLEYTHTDKGGDFFSQLPDAVYLAERIHGKGVLGDRNRCNLKGSKTAQTSTGHSYKVFDMLTLEEYYNGQAITNYEERHTRLEAILEAIDPTSYAGKGKLCSDQQELDLWLKIVVKDGYEGVMCVNPKWKWSHHKTTRVIKFCKYKKRPTADLYCFSYKVGTGKYEGLIGSLLLTDSTGRMVDVGSGMSDEDRRQHPNYFIGKVVEVFYEQIVDTYIQPTFGSEYEGVLIRHDKGERDID